MIISINPSDVAELISVNMYEIGFSCIDKKSWDETQTVLLDAGCTWPGRMQWVNG